MCLAVEYNGHHHILPQITVNWWRDIQSLLRCLENSHKHARTTILCTGKTVGWKKKTLKKCSFNFRCGLLHFIQITSDKHFSHLILTQRACHIFTLILVCEPKGLSITINGHVKLGCWLKKRSEALLISEGGEESLVVSLSGSVRLADMLRV